MVVLNISANYLKAVVANVFRKCYHHKSSSIVPLKCPPTAHNKGCQCPRVILYLVRGSYSSTAERHQAGKQAWISAITGPTGSAFSIQICHRQLVPLPQIGHLCLKIVILKHLPSALFLGEPFCQGPPVCVLQTSRRGVLDCTCSSSMVFTVDNGPHVLPKTTQNSPEALLYGGWSVVAVRASLFAFTVLFGSLIGFWGNPGFLGVQFEKPLP